MRLTSAVSVLGIAAIACGSSTGCATFGEDRSGEADGSAGGPDGGAPPDAPPSTASSSFCSAAGPAKRCLDFDRPAQVVAPFGFDELFVDRDQPPNGTLSIFGMDSVSAPNNLRVETLGGGSAGGDIVIDPAGALPPAIRVKLRFRYDVLVPGDSTSSHFLWLRCRTKDDASVYLKLQKSGKLGLKQEVSSGIDPSSASGFDLGAWHQLEVVYDWSAAQLSVTLNGAAPFGAAPLPLSKLSCSEPLVLRFGSWVSSGAGDYVMRFDDILVDW